MKLSVSFNKCAVDDFIGVRNFFLIESEVHEEQLVVVPLNQNNSQLKIGRSFATLHLIIVYMPRIELKIAIAWRHAGRVV